MAPLDTHSGKRADEIEWAVSQLIESALGKGLVINLGAETLRLAETNGLTAPETAALGDTILRAAISVGVAVKMTSLRATKERGRAGMHSGMTGALPQLSPTSPR